MRKNIGNIDRGVRIFLALAFAAIYFLEIVTGKFAILLPIASGMLILTSLVRTCPVYYPFGINTMRKTVD